MLRIILYGIFLIAASALGSCAPAPNAPSHFETLEEKPAASPDQSERPNGILRLEDLAASPEGTTREPGIDDEPEEILQEVSEEGPELEPDFEDVLLEQNEDDGAVGVTSSSAKLYALSGVVKDKHHPSWGIAGAKVAITGGAATKTDTSGRYSLRSRAGSFTVKITKAGYKGLSIKVTMKGTTKLNASLTAVIPAGATARCNNRTWSTAKKRAGACSGQSGVAYWICPGLLCTPAPAPSAPPPPPPPPPSTPVSTRFHVWGGFGYGQYLGYFSCVYCTDYGSDSLNNDYGRYGSQYSFTSIRNTYSQYGSPYSTYSSCNPYASNPPRVYNATRTVYYGELTVNPYRLYGLDFLIPWLRADVCRH